MKALDFIWRESLIRQCLECMPSVLKNLVLDYASYELVPHEMIDTSIGYDDFYIEPDEIIGYIKPDVYTQEEGRGGWHVLRNGSPTNVRLPSQSNRVYNINNDAVLMYNAIQSYVWHKDGQYPKILPRGVKPVVHDAKVYFVLTNHVLHYYDPIACVTHMLDTNIEKITVIGNQLRIHRWLINCEEPKYGYCKELYLLLPHGIYTMDKSMYLRFPKDMQRCHAFGRWLFVVCDNSARCIVDLFHNSSIVFYDDIDYFVDGSTLYSVRDSTIFIY